MDKNDSSVTCSVNMEWLTSQGTIQRKQNYKTAVLRLIRNEFQDMFVEVTAEKAAPIRLKLKDINVHNKFMQEGKASIKFQQVKCTIFISNAPPSQLLSFLRTIFIKMTGDKSKTSNTSLRTQLLSNKPNSFEEISPVTFADLDKAKAKLSKSTDTTPSPLAKKRKLSERNGDVKAPAAKKLYATSPTSNQVLTEEQQEVLDACLKGQNVFFTGSAGTGKSFLLKKIIASLPPAVTIATASTGKFHFWFITGVPSIEKFVFTTGVAACHIGGITLHQFAGIGDGEATLERSYQMASRPAQSQIWRKCKHLIIDEISMVDGNYFEVNNIVLNIGQESNVLIFQKIEAVARHVRRSEKCFGGIQLILCGDFLQLPPVVKKNFNSNRNNDIRFCFQTPTWENCVQACYELTHVHRQSDAEFVDILNRIRMGSVSNDIVDKLMATSKQKIEQDGILATRLCSHTQEANTINESKLNQLKGESKVYDAQDSDSTGSKLLNEQTQVPQKLVLKIGAQVMLLKNVNFSSGLVNGARGVVIGLNDAAPVVRFRNQEYSAKCENFVIKTASGGTFSRKQIPLKLAWSFSIHKSQGLTLDCVEMSLANVFEAGQAYVALSRAQSLEKLRILDFKASQVWANPDVLKFYKHFQQRMDQLKLIPLGIRKLTSNSKKSINKSKSLSGKILSKPLINIS